MALDFHQIDNNEYLFGLEDNQFGQLAEISEEFQIRTGFVIDHYGDFKMSLENQQTLIKIVDNYMAKNDLNKNKAKTLAIIEFRTLLNYFFQKKIVFQLKGD